MLNDVVITYGLIVTGLKEMILFVILLKTLKPETSPNHNELRHDLGLLVELLQLGLFSNER